MLGVSKESVSFSIKTEKTGRKVNRKGMSMGAKETEKKDQSRKRSKIHWECFYLKF